MRKYIHKKELSAQYLIKIIEIFKKNKWPIENSEELPSLFNRYCRRILAIGENKKRDLILELTGRYLWVQEEQYLDYLKDVLSKFINSHDRISENSTIYVLPLIAPEDEGKTKSSYMLAYMFNSVKLRYVSNLSNYKFEIVNDKSAIASYLSDKDSFLLLVDDYIGTGETVEKCVSNILELGIEINQISVLALVAQENGLNYLRSLNIAVFSSVTCKRGISDFYTGKTLENNIKIMQSIENKMSIKENFNFGYGESEALITMCRTPNNTFPVFWDECGNMKIAPFPRF